ncbi:MAG: carboxylating nicotinate-nucleotide diphosphorylase [Pseudomonadota bacterium]
MTHHHAPIPHNTILTAVTNALNEDLGLTGDITTTATIPETARMTASIAARQAGVVSGLEVANVTFASVHGGIRLTKDKHDGDAIQSGDTIATVSGPARSVLTAERVALNFMGRMSGIATMTKAYVDAVAGTNATIVDTRKTSPGLRPFEKYAVKCGGGGNHRFGLFDAVLIKDNHIAGCGGINEALQAAQKHAGHLVKIEIEVDTLDQLKTVDFEIADCVLLDNMTPDQLREAVAFIAGRALAEASGGVTLDTVRSIAETGVDLISVGALTHSAPVLDLGLDYKGT